MNCEECCGEAFGSADIQDSMNFLETLVCKPFFSSNSYSFRDNLKEYSNKVQKAMTMGNRGPRILTFSGLRGVPENECSVEHKWRGIVQPLHSTREETEARRVDK